jgi:DNA-binding CsgD family transcriptional regulator
VLIGREAERRVIERLLAGARIGHGGVLVITGEPGVGKTALLDDAARHLDGMGVLRAAGSEPEQGIPFGALHQVLRPALGHLDHIPAPQAAALSAALLLAPGETGDRFAIGAATLSLLCRFAEERPVVVLLDDVHLFDRPSADALAFAARRLAADPVVVLATARDPEPAGTRELPRLPLSGIDLAAAEELVSRHAAASPETVARLHRATAGNPLALIELAGTEEAPLSPAAPQPVPAALVTAFAARARSLGEAGRSAVTVAAVAGSDLRLVARTCALLGVDVGALAEAADAGLVRVDGDRVEFRHPLVRAAVYGDAGQERRRSIHRIVAKAALGAGEPDRHAWHLAEATLGPDERVADLVAEAATRAHRRSAHDVAAAAFERAAHLSQSGARHASFCVAAAESAWLAGAGPRAVALLDEAGEPESPGVRLRALELRGGIAARTGSLTESRDLLRAAVRAAPDADYRVVLLADAVNVCYYLADAAAAVELAGEIEELLGRVIAPRSRMIGQIAAGMARILANRGGADQIRAAVELFASSGQLRDDQVRADQRRLPWLILGPMFLRDRDTGTGDELRRAVLEVRAEAAVGALPFLLFHVARDEATTNQWARAEATYDEAVRLARETGQDTELSMCLAGLAWLAARLGREDQCRALVAEAMPICRARDIHIGRIWSLFALGELALGLGDARGALAHLEELDALLGTLGLSDPDLSPAPELADVLARLGRRDDAWRTALRHRDAALAKGQPWAMARAERSMGMLGEDGDLDARFGAALERHARTPDVFETARTQLAYGARLRRARRRVDARPPLRAALATFEELGAVRWADLAATELAATGAAIRRREPSGVRTLTPQELRVSLLLGEGRTTREVAAALFLSPKTVEYHLRKVYTKLGIRSRTELADQLSTLSAGD